MFCRPYACRIDSGNSCAKRLSGHVRGLLGPVEGASGCEESARRPSCAIPRCACHPTPLLSLDVAPEPSREKARPRSMPRTVAMLCGSLRKLGAVRDCSRARLPGRYTGRQHTHTLTNVARHSLTGKDRDTLAHRPPDPDILCVAVSIDHGATASQPVHRRGAQRTGASAEWRAPYLT